MSLDAKLINKLKRVSDNSHHNDQVKRLPPIFLNLIDLPFWREKVTPARAIINAPL